MTFPWRMPVIAATDELTLPATWLPNAPVKLIVSHWTAGGYVASSLDREHYHFLIEGDEEIEVVRGHHSLTAVKPPLVEGKYAAHTLGTNSYAAGVSVCSMAGAIESPFNPGKYPMKAAQWGRLVELNALLCKRYGITVGPKTVLTHAEVQVNLGNRQRGKWDIAKLAFDPKYMTAKAVGDLLRTSVAKKLAS